MLANLPIAIAWGLSIWLCIAVARGVRLSAVDYFQSRLLLHGGIVNALAANVVGITIATVHIARHIADGESIDIAVLAPAILLMILPFRAAWNFFTATSRVARTLRLTKEGCEELLSELTLFSSIVDTPPPMLRKSSRVTAPLIVGRTSKSATLVLPASWNELKQPGRKAAVFHELAHLRNGDMSLFACSRALSRDVLGLIIALTLIALLASLAGYDTNTVTMRASVVVTLVLLQLRVIQAFVLRDRELRADETVARLVTRGYLAAAILDHTLLIRSGIPHRHEGPTPSALFQRIGNWIGDRALFGERRRLWSFLLHVGRFLGSTHPTLAKRNATITATVEERPTAAVSSWVNALWTGVLLGTISALVGLGGIWCERIWLNVPDDELFHLTGYSLLVTGPIATGFLAVVLVVPAWTSVAEILPTSRYLFALLLRCLAALAVASVTGLFVFLADWFSPESRVAAAMTVAWNILVFSLGAAWMIVMLVLWLTTRYIRRRLVVEAIPLLTIAAPALLLLAGMLAAVLVFVLPQHPMLAGLGAASAVVGIALSGPVVGQTGASGIDAWMVLRVGSCVRRFEGAQMRRLGHPPPDIDQPPPCTWTEVYRGSPLGGHKPHSSALHVWYSSVVPIR